MVIVCATTWAISAAYGSYHPTPIARTGQFVTTGTGRPRPRRGRLAQLSPSHQQQAMRDPAGLLSGQDGSQNLPEICGAFEHHHVPDSGQYRVSSRSLSRPRGHIPTPDRPLSHDQVNGDAREDSLRHRDVLRSSGRLDDRLRRLPNGSPRLVRQCALRVTEHLTRDRDTVTGQEPGRIFRAHLN